VKLRLDSISYFVIIDLSNKINCLCFLYCT